MDDRAMWSDVYSSSNASTGSFTNALRSYKRLGEEEDKARRLRTDNGNMYFEDLFERTGSVATISRSGSTDDTTVPEPRETERKNRFRRTSRERFDMGTTVEERARRRNVQDEKSDRNSDSDEPGSIHVQIDEAICRLSALTWKDIVAEAPMFETRLLNIKKDGTGPRRQKPTKRDFIEEADALIDTWEYCLLVCYGTLLVLEHDVQNIREAIEKLEQEIESEKKGYVEDDGMPGPHGWLNPKAEATMAVLALRKTLEQVPSHVEESRMMGFFPRLRWMLETFHDLLYSDNSTSLPPAFQLKSKELEAQFAHINIDTLTRDSIEAIKSRKRRMHKPIGQEIYLPGLIWLDRNPLVYALTEIKLMNKLTRIERKKERDLNVSEMRKLHRLFAKTEQETHQSMRIMDHWRNLLERAFGDQKGHSMNRMYEYKRGELHQEDFQLRKPSEYEQDVAKQDAAMGEEAVVDNVVAESSAMAAARGAASQPPVMWSSENPFEEGGKSGKKPRKRLDSALTD